MSYSNGILSSPSAKGQPGPPGKPGVPGVGYKLTADGNFDIDTKRLTNVAESVDDNDAVSLKVLKEHTQVSQNNYHLQPSFKIYKEFGDKSQLTVGTPPNTPSNHFFNNHKTHHDPYIVDKEAGDTGFGGQAWSSMKLKGNQLESGSYTVIFEIFVISPNNLFLSDDTIIYHVYGDSHYSINTFNSNKINGQYTRSMIQFTTDGGAGADDGIKFQIKYFGSQYNNNIKFLFYSRVIKGSQSTSFNHSIFNVSDVQDNHTILYFENLNLNGNLINGLGNPVDNNDATNKTYVDSEIAKLPQPDTDVLKLDGSKAMTGNLDMGNKNITNTNKITTRAIDLSGPIDMFNNRIIGVRDGIYDKHAVNKQQLDAVKNLKADKTQLTNYLLRDGSNTMTGDLDIDEHYILSVKNLTDHKVDDAYSDIVKDLKSVVNKEYLNQNFLKINGNYFDLNQKVIKNSAPHDDGSYDNNTLVSKAFVDAEIAKLPKPDTDVLKLDGSKAMTGNLDMGMKNILNIDTLNDYTNNSEKDRDLKSAVNKQYLNTHFLKIMGKGDNDFNLGGQIIKNCEPYYDGLFDDNSLVSKAFVDAEIAKLPKPATDVLKTDGSKAMNGNLDMANNSIINLKEPGASDSNHAASVKFVNTIVNNSESGMINLINDKIKKSEEGSIEVVQQENVFKKVMDDDEFKEDDSDIHKVGVRNKNFHLVNKKTYEFNIDYDSSLGYYSTRLSIDLIYLPVGSYTMVYEMYIDNGITVDEIDSTSGTLVVGKINSKIDGTKTRSIINFTKYTISPGFDDLDIDIKLKGKTDPQTTINVVVYGVKGQVNNVSVNLWDRFYYYDNTSIKFELPVDMNGNKITGVADGVDDSDVMNKAQFDKIQSYYFYTNDLKHNNKKNVNFPNFYKYPFDSNITEIINIKLSGYYHIIYTDYYKGNTSIFRIHRNITSIYTLTVDAKSDWTQLTINIVHKFESGDYLQFDFNNNKSKLYGVGRSTFYIKYLHP